MRATKELLRTGNRMLRSVSRRKLAALAVIGFSACSISLVRAQAADAAVGKYPRSAYAALEEAPDSARTRRNPFEGNAREAIAGGKLFEQHCAECHGEKAGGTKRAPSLLKPEVQQATPGTLFWILTNGVVWHGMPVWSKLPEPQRWQIVTFLKSLGARSTEPGRD